MADQSGHFKDKSIDELIKYIADIWELIESKCGDTKHKAEVQKHKKKDEKER